MYNVHLFKKEWKKGEKDNQLMEQIAAMSSFSGRIIQITTRSATDAEMKDNLST